MAKDDGVTRVHRLLRLVTLLQGGRPVPLDELLEELRVSRRTLFRDLKVLKDAGVPHYHEAGKGYRIARGYFLPPVNLTVSETLGLMVMAKFAVGHRGRPALPAGVSAIYKLLTAVPEPIRAACGELAEAVSVDLPPQATGDRERDCFPDLARAIDERRACRVTYTSPTDEGTRTFEFEPYVLHFAHRGWYAFGRSLEHDEVRVLKLLRVDAIEPLDRRFDRPEGFTVEQKLGKAWALIPEGEEHDVVLEFEPKVATNVAEVRWHPTQRADWLPDGRVRLRFTVDGLREIAWWVCGYADQVRVVSPPALRDRVRDMHARASARHGDGTAEERG